MHCLEKNASWTALVVRDTDSDKLIGRVSVIDCVLVAVCDRVVEWLRVGTRVWDPELDRVAAKLQDVECEMEQLKKKTDPGQVFGRYKKRVLAAL